MGDSRGLFKRYEKDGGRWTGVYFQWGIDARHRRWSYWLDLLGLFEGKGVP